MILNILLWLAHFTFVILIAYLTLEYVRSGRRSLDLALFLFLWVFYTTAYLLLFGLAGWLNPFALGLSAIIGIAVLLGIRGTRSRMALIPASLSILKSELNSWWHSLPLWLRWLSGIAAAFATLRFSFLIWALPPFVWDSLTYHLTNVGQWIQDGRIGVFETSVLRTYSPANYEVFATWFGVFIHHDVIIEASGLPAYLLGGLSVYALTQGLGGKRTASTIAVVTYLSTPAFLFAVTNTKNDPNIAAVYLLCSALIVNGLDREGRSKRKRLAGLITIFFAGILYALGTKTYIVHIFPGLVLITLGMVLMGGKSRSPRKIWEEISDDLSNMSVLGRYLLLFLICMAVFLGSYWYVRNLVLAGTPFYPYSVRVEGTTVLETEGSSFDLSLENFLYNLQAFWSKFGDKQYRIVPDLSNTTGWGWVVYSMGLVASFWAFIQNKKFRLVLAGFLISFLIIALSLPRSPWNLRYVIWLPAVAAVGLGLFFEFAGQWTGMGRYALVGLFVFCLGMNAVMSLNYNLIPMQRLQEMLALPTMERAAGKFHLQVPMEYESEYEYVPKDATLGYNLNENGFVYPLLRADFSQDLAYIPVSQGETCHQIADEMRSKNTRYLFVAPVQTADDVISILEACATSGDILRERAPGLFVIKSNDS